MATLVKVRNRLVKRISAFDVGKSEAKACDIREILAKTKSLIGLDWEFANDLLDYFELDGSCVDIVKIFSAKRKKKRRKK